MAGKHQVNIFSSLVENFDTAREVLETSANSADSAMKEHEKWSQSLEAKLTKLKSTWQSLSQSFLSSDFLKSGINLITSFVNVLDTLISKFGALPTLITAVATGMSLFKNKGFFKVIKDEATGAATGITTIFGQVAKSVNASLSKINIQKGFTKTLNQDDIAAIRNYANAVNRGVSSTTAFKKCMTDASDAAKAYVKSGQAATQGVAGFVKQQQAAQVSVLAQNKSLGSAKALMKEYYSGCKTTGMAQTDFANAVVKTNPQLATAMTSCSSVKGAMVKYGVSLVGAKIKTIALQAATTALDMALTMGVSVAIQAFVGWLSDLSHKAEDTAEKVEELTSKFKEQYEELQKLKSSYDTSNESSMISKYEKLSKGIGNENKNIALTADEYSEYLDIVNEIADQIPSLITGYDSQGNAVLSCKGNVEELVEAYENLIHIQNQEILTNAGDIEEDFENTVKKQSGTGWWSNNHGFWAGTLEGFNGLLGGIGLTDIAGGIFDYELKSDTASALNNLLNSEDEDARNDLLTRLKNNAAEFTAAELRTALKNAGVDVHWYDNVYDVLEEQLKTDPSKIKGIIDNYYAQFDVDVEEQKTIALAKLSEAFDISSALSGLNYGNISETLQNIAYQTVNSLDYGFFSELLESGQTVEQWVTEMLDQLNSIGKTDSAQIEAAFDLQTQFNGGEISYGEYVDGIQNVEKLIDNLGLSDELTSQLKLALNTEEVTETYDALKKRLTSEEFGIQMKADEAEKFLDGLSASEYAVFVDLVASGEIDLSDFDIESLRKYIEEQAELQEALNYTIAIDVETEGVESLNTALSESVSATGLSSESIEALKSRYADLESEGYNLSAMFEETSNGIHLNKQAVSELEQAYASNKLSETNDKLQTLKNRYDELTDEINNCTNASDRAALYTEQKTIVAKINDLATLAAQYEGLTSAYNAWQNAESAGSERDMYEGIIEGFETVGDEISRGWYDDGTIEFLELLTGKTNLASKSGKELKEIWNNLDNTIGNSGYSVKDFFTVNNDGDSTNTGVYNFLRTVESFEDELGDVIKRDKDDNIIGFDFEVAAKKDENGNIIKNGDEVIAETLGISEELVQIMLRAADDAGFVINLEGAYTQLADLKTEAETARDTLISLQKDGLEQLSGVDVNFDFDAEGNDLLEEQARAVELLDKFKDGSGKIDLEMEGAQEALDIAEYLTIKLDDATEPKFMQIDTSEVDAELREPIEKIQEIGDLCREKHLVSLTGDTEELDEVQDKIDAIAEEIEDLDPEVKAQIGIGEDWDAQTIADKIEKGEIEIPAELELDVQMSDDLKDIRLMMMKQLGLVDDEEVKLKIGYDIDDSTVDKLIKDGKEEIVLEFITNNEKWFNTLTDAEKEIVVNLVAQGETFEGLSDDKKEIVIEFVANNEEWFNGLSDEDKEIAVKIVAKNEEWFSGLKDEEKEIVIDLVTSGVDIETLTDDEKKEVIIDFVTENADWFDELSDGDKEIVVDIVSSGVDLDDLDEEKRQVVIKYAEENKDLFDNLSDDEKKVVVKYVADGKDFDKLTEKEKKVIVKLIGDDSEIKGWTPEQKEAMVKYIVDGGDVEDWTPEQKQAWAQYLVDHGDIDGWTPEMKQAWAQYLVDGGDVEGWTPEMKEAYAKYIVDGGDVSGYTPEDKKALAKYIVDGGDPANYQPPSKTQNVKADLDSSEPDDYQPKNKSFTVKAFLQKIGDGWNNLISGGSTRSVVNGTANVNGNAFVGGTAGKAFKRGNWGTKDSGTALVGELGAETLVRDGRYYTIGDNGAEFINYKKGDIIFNHKQTEELFKYGKVTSGNGRGKALVSGTAFAFTTDDERAEKIARIKASGNKTSGYSSSGYGGGTEVKSSSSSSGSSSSSSSSDDADDFEETLDWIETKISRIERAIDNLDQTASNVYKTWSERNKALVSEISNVEDEIAIQQAAYERYIKEANSVGLSSSWAAKVRNGEINIETITNESLADKISEYEDWYNKALDCLDAIEELKETEASLYAQRVENVSTKYDGILGVIEHEKNMLEEYINQSEAQAWLVSANYYNALASNEQKTIAQLEKQKAEMLSELQTAMESGTIEKGSESWYELCNSIDEVTLSIAESQTQLKEYAQTIEQLSWETFDLLQDKISSVTEESEFLIDLLSSSKLYDDNGQLTDEGSAVMGLHGQNYNSFMYQADKYGAEAARLKKQLESDPYDQDLIDRRNELLELQRESILAAEDEKNAIKDLVSEGIDAELSALENLIDKKNEQLQSEKDLYDYQKKVKEQTEEISSLEKQLASYANDDSSEAMLKKQQISNDLESAREELAGTEYDKLIDDTSALLDELYDEYSELLNMRLDNLDALVESVIAEINADASSISATLSEKAESVGYTLSDSIKTIWDTNTTSTTNVITTYGEKFTSAQTTTNNALNTINTNLQNMITQLNSIAKTNVKSASTSSAANSKEANATDTSKGELSSSSSSSTTSYPYGKASETSGNIGYGSKGAYVKAIQYALNKLGYGNSGTNSVDGIFGSGTKSAVKSFQSAMGIQVDGIVGKQTRAKFKAKGYATGIRKINSNEDAWTQEDGQEYIVRPSDGAILTPVAKGDSVLNAQASSNIWDMANSPAEFIKDNLNLGNANVPNNSNVQNSYSQHIDNVVFRMDNVKNYSELLSEMQRDKNFEKLILAMTVDQIAGKSPLAKGKAIR